MGRQVEQYLAYREETGVEFALVQQSAFASLLDISVYPNHPPTCQAYQCDLLKKSLTSALTREQDARAGENRYYGLDKRSKSG